MKKLFLTIFCIFAIFIVLFFPEIVTDGVRQGIQLNLASVIPALLPFMILINIMLKHNLCQYISYFFTPILSRIFKISSMGCFAIIIGFTCGYPMGAKIIGDLYNNRSISKSEACYLITFCNNCSITFLFNYILFNCVNSDFSPKMAIALVYFPPVITGIINKFLLNPNLNNAKHTICNRVYIQTNNFNPFLNAIKSLSILSVYIICFTIISNLIATFSFLPEILKCILAGFTEITSGANYVTTSSLNTNIQNFLVLASTVFGGFSILFQSFEQLPDNSLKKYYVMGKIEQLLIFSILYVII